MEEAGERTDYREGQGMGEVLGKCREEDRFQGKEVALHSHRHRVVKDQHSVVGCRDHCLPLHSGYKLGGEVVEALQWLLC